MIRRVLLTGASGLIGRAVLPALAAAGYDVHAVSRRTAVPVQGAAFDLADLADLAAAQHLVARVEPDAIVHLAGGPRGDRHEVYRANVLTTVHLLEAAGSLAARPFTIVFGSAAEYGDAASPIGESAPLRPLTEYGRAKVAQTVLAEAIARSRGIPLAVLRPFNVVAADLPASSALGNLRDQLRAGAGPVREVRCGRLDVVRDFVPLALVVEGVLALLRAPAPGAPGMPGLTINLCSGVGLDLESILRAMAEKLGVELAIAVDRELASLPAAPCVIGDPTRMQSLLGLACRPTPESLAEILLAGR
jgi:nucleoside-diphosphate-sugar epimerase